MVKAKTLYLHRKAPPKPNVGAPCNGCGVCCASEPCPLGMVLSRRLHGRCAALAWDAGRTRYVCQAVAAPEQLLPRGARVMAPLVAKLARRWISAGSGCDATLQVGAVDADAGADAPAPRP